MGVDMSGFSDDMAWLDDGEPATPPSESPIHPLPQLQGPFEESITEAAEGSYSQWEVVIDAQSRRDQILTLPEYERLCGRRWRQKPNEKYHPLWKIVAQITFGLHLLAKNLAKSKIDVIKILQTHVSELDGFIERTTEDLYLARNDIKERFDLLRLPLDNRQLFRQMLDDPVFRKTVMVDNDRIDHIIKRSAIAMDDCVKDIKKGSESIGGLLYYIKDVRTGDNDYSPEFMAVCDAMMGNVDGWDRELSRLKRSAYKLAMGITQLNRLSTEIQRLVGEASRKMLAMNAPVIPRRQSRITFRLATPRVGSPASIDKPLPTPEISDSPTSEPQRPPVVRQRSQPVLRGNGSRLSPAPSPSLWPPAHHHTNDELRKTGHSNNIFGRSDNSKQPQRPLTAASQRPSTDSHQDGLAPLRSFTKSSSKVKLGSNRLYRSASKTFSILSNVRHVVKVENPPQTTQTHQPPDLSEQSWIDFDRKMSWAHGLEDPGETHAFTTQSDLPPEFPHLDFLALSDDDTSSEGEHEDEADQKSVAATNISDESSQVTALPSLGSFTANFDDDPTSWYDDTAAEVASTYSVKSRKRRKRPSNEPPLPHNSNDVLTRAGGDAKSSARQSLPSQKANLFSLRPKGGKGAPKPLTIDQTVYTVQPGWSFPRKSTSSLSPLSPTFPTSPVNEVPDSPPISPGTPFSPMYLAQIAHMASDSGTAHPENHANAQLSTPTQAMSSTPTSPNPFLTVPGTRTHRQGDTSAAAVAGEPNQPGRRLLKPNLKKFASTASLNKSLREAKPELPTGRVYSNPMLANR